jgi:hypothetical protein
MQFACLLATVIGWTLPSAATAEHAADRSPGRGGEARLRAIEVATLGPAHAAEHARARAAARRQRRARRRCRAMRPAARRRCLAAAGLPGRARAAQVPLPSLSGSWSPPFSIPVPAVHAALLPTGKVMFFSVAGTQPSAEGNAWLWDPATGAQREVDPPLVYNADTQSYRPANLWCASQSHLADGRLLVVGGTARYRSEDNPSGTVGLDRIFLFNPWTESWIEGPRMRAGRWYPTSSLLPDGRTAITSGLIDRTTASNLNPDLELYTPSSDPTQPGTLRLLTTFFKPGKGLPEIPNLYPHQTLLASGRTLINGPGVGDSWFLKQPGDPPVFSWSNVHNLTRTRIYAAATPLPGGPSGPTKVLQLGGFPAWGQTATATGETYSDVQPGPWQAAPSMQAARAHHNVVLLPNGSMVSIGGGSGAPGGNLYAVGSNHRAVELWNPSDGTWRLGASQQEYRAYHSTALLLPDGRVASAGDDYHGGKQSDTVEIYSPPYLHNGARPTISSAPSAVGYGQTFRVDTPNGNITKAVLIAPGATTHANEMSQRYLSLVLTRVTGGVNVQAPPSRNGAPPSYYMLFLVNDAGVPSVARFVRLG